MMFPYIHDQCWTKGSCWVHTSASQIELKHKIQKTLSMNNTVTSLHTEYYAQDWNRVCIPENIYIYSEELLEDVFLNMHKQLLYWTQLKGLI